MSLAEASHRPRPPQPPHRRPAPFLAAAVALLLAAPLLAARHALLRHASLPIGTDLVPAVSSTLPLIPPHSWHAPVLLYIGPVWGHRPRPRNEPCPRVRCRLTPREEGAHVGIYHLRVRSPRRLPLSVFRAMEPPAYYPYVRHPVGYDATMTYAASATFWTPYYSYARHGDLRGDASRGGLRGDASRGGLRGARAPAAAFVASNCVAWRLRLAARLARSFNVSRAGACFGARLRDKGELLRAHLFVLVAENSVAEDYVTEKVYDALSSGALPIYAGAPNVAEFVPNRSVIEWRHFRSARQLGEYLTYLVANPAEYATWHEWRRKPLPSWFRRRFGVPDLNGTAAQEKVESLPCRVCAWAAERLGEAYFLQRYKLALIERARTFGPDELFFNRFFNDTSG
ncbi:hypothetical protein AB1Y20_012648 [Prymnesium parvum]|uniref:Fucosyltransferase n=1 Tax=Prymnesium parvum TaxID=97485 RepID=A0AB34IIH2_PRYPA